MILAQLNIPTKSPTKSPISNAIGNGRLYLATHPAEIQPDNAMIDPTDKSIPPRIITIVIPHARNRFVEICLNTLNIFCLVKNDPLVFGKTDKNTHNTKKATIIPRFSLKYILTAFPTPAVAVVFFVFSSICFFPPLLCPSYSAASIITLSCVASL